MRPWIKLTILGVLIYAVFLVATLPARVLTDRLPEGLPIQLAGVDGSVWNGRAASLSVEDIPIGQVQWNLQPLGLLLGKLQGTLRLDGPLLQGDSELKAGFGGDLSLRNTRAHASPQLIDQFQPLPVALTGDFFLNLEGLDWRAGESLPLLKGELVWAQAGLGAPYAVALGEYTMDLESQDDGIHGKIRAENSPYRTSGNLVLTPQGQYRLALRLVPDNNTPPEMRDALKFLGRPDQRGAVTIRQQGNLGGLAR